jgi:hypothetical protein
MIFQLNYLLLSLIDPQAPLAYIDPNTGGMLFQMLAILFAAFSGILFFFSRQIKTAFARLRRSLRKSDEPVKEEPNPDQPEK